MSIFYDMKTKLNICEVYERYCNPIVRGKSLCYFHPDKHPSVTFKGEVCSCWVCGYTYDIFDLVAAVFQYEEQPKISAARKLNSDFALGFDIDAEIQKTSKRMRQIQSDKVLIEEFNSEWKHTYDVLCKYEKFLKTRQYPDIEERYQHEKYIGYLLDTMTEIADIDDIGMQVQFLNYYRKEVKAIEHRR